MDLGLLNGGSSVPLRLLVQKVQECENLQFLRFWPKSMIFAIFLHFVLISNQHKKFTTPPKGMVNTSFESPWSILWKFGNRLSKSLN